MATNLDPSSVLSGIPSGLRNPLLQTFNSIVKNFREGRWEPAELNGGKLCEIAYNILKGHVDGKFSPKPKKPANMIDACRDLEKADPNLFSRSVRIHIPRTLIALYEVRNNRGVGHAGGDVNPNHMDSAYVLTAAKWIMAELVRIFHNVDTVSATQVVEALTDRTLPLIWEVGENRRVLNTSLNLKDKALALLYGCPHPVLEADLARWVEHPRLDNFRRDFLVKAHNEKLIEYDKKTRTIHLSPLGTKYVEENVPLEI